MTMLAPHARAVSHVERLFAQISWGLGGVLADPTNRARTQHMLGLVARVGPELGDRHLLTLARFGLATFLFDDLADRTEIEADEIVWRAEQLCAAVTDSPDPELHYDPTATILRQVAADLREAGADPRLFDHWVSATAAAFRAMATQRVQAEGRRRGESVSPAEIAEAGRLSVAIEALAATSWVLLRLPFEAVAALAPQAAALATAARLANDLRSLPRDREEGATNPLLDLDEAAIEGLAAGLEQMLEQLLAQAAACTDGLGAVAARAASFDQKLVTAIVRFYAAQDFHDIPSSMPKTQGVRRAGVGEAPVRRAPPAFRYQALMGPMSKTC